MIEELKTLTPRQQEVYDLMLTELSYPEIMERLGITIGGLRFHIGYILIKLDCDSRIALLCEHFECSDNHTFKRPEFLNELSEQHEIIFNYVVKGYKTAEIAALMGYSYSYIIVRRCRIYRNAKVNSAFELVRKCYVENVELRSAA